MNQNTQRLIILMGAAPISVALLQNYGVFAFVMGMCMFISGYLYLAISLNKEHKAVGTSQQLPDVILAILRTGPKHGYEIAQIIKHSNVELSAEGKLFPTLYNLEMQGRITATTKEENGRTRRYYALKEE